MTAPINSRAHHDIPERGAPCFAGLVHDEKHERGTQNQAWQVCIHVLESEDPLRLYVVGNMLTSPLLWLCLAFRYQRGESFVSRSVSLASTGKSDSSRPRTPPPSMSSPLSPPAAASDDSSGSSSSPRRPGILIVGFGGGNGVTAAAGVLANQKNYTWEGPTGRNSPNYLGCITQLPSKGGSGGYRERYALADANSAAIGGWDVRPTPLGEALYNARILDFDLVRQLREEMDSLRLLPGVWDPDFIGESQHASATHVTGDGDSQQSRLDHLRKDIREFREGEGVTGHVTVIWSASVERPSERDFQEPSEVGVDARCFVCSGRGERVQRCCVLAACACFAKAHTRKRAVGWCVGDQFSLLPVCLCLGLICSKSTHVQNGPHGQARRFSCIYNSTVATTQHTHGSRYSTAVSACVYTILGAVSPPLRSLRMPSISSHRNHEEGFLRVSNRDTCC